MIYGLESLTPDHHLITTLGERWRPETNTFNMYHEECTITLQDVEMLTCMPVFGEVVCAEYEKDRFNYTALYGEVLREISDSTELMADRCLKLSWLQSTFSHPKRLGDDDHVFPK
ncbi:Serine/threonine-protein phosphatase 7 long form homolog [Linum grandiflorum]